MVFWGKMSIFAWFFIRKRHEEKKRFKVSLLKGHQTARDLPIYINKV